MNIVLLRTKLREEEINQLIGEFPSFLFISPSEFSCSDLGRDDWGKVEIFFGNRLSREELVMAARLRWIHASAANLDAFCLKDIEKRGDIIMTCSRNEDSLQTAEYVLGVCLAYLKNLFQWQKSRKDPTFLWASGLRENTATFKDKLFLQIGLGTLGSAITRLAGNMGMCVWGAQKKPSFHPHCRKVIAYEDLAAVLPSADIVSVALPGFVPEKFFLSGKMIKAMKKGTILTIIGSARIVDEKTLAEESEKFRGIAFDVVYQTPLPKKSPLWGLDNALITPGIASRPKLSEGTGYKIFRFNLRQYLHGNFSDMRNVIGSRELFFA